MTTQFEIDCALMAGASYISTRPDVNKFPVPDGWSESVEDRQTKSSGFEATYFTKGTEVVISYAGTGPGIADWIYGNIPLSQGGISDQLRQAADYYLQVKASVPVGTNITITGHSLGGGLASLIAVLFGETAVTFDQAPFRNAALIFSTTDETGMSTTHSAARDLRTYLTGRVPETLLTRLDAYLDAAEQTNPNPDAADTLAGREAKVTDINVQGEVLGYLPFGRIGSQSDILNSSAGASSIDLHSQALLSAYLQSDQTASVNAATTVKESLSQVTFKLTDLLRMFFDKNLFYNDPNNKDAPLPNFIERLVRHQAGGASDVTTPDAMVSRFTRDLWKIAQDGGLTMQDSPWNTDSHLVGDALIAFAMQMYYEDTSNATNNDKELFAKITGGLQFDLADVSKDFKAAIEAPQIADYEQRRKALIEALGKVKGFEQYFKNYLEQDTVFTAEELGQIKEFLPYMRDWYVQAGTDGMVATDTLNRGAFMLGGSGADTLTGGTADDLLVGNAEGDILSGGAGNDILLGCAGYDSLKGGDGVDLLIGGKDDDTLDGEAGNDLLKGGEGLDTYAFTGNYGTDIITDSDGSGMIKVDELRLGSADQTFESIYKDATSGQTIVKLNGGNSLVVLKEGTSDRILVNDWSAARALGITLQDKTPVVPVATLSGDFKKAIDGTDYLFANGNYVNDGDEANALDLISGTAGNDVIDGKGGDDALSGMAGDDRISGFCDAANNYAYDLYRRAA